MKGSNIKSKMGRFTYSACALFFAGGLLGRAFDRDAFVVG